MAIHAQPRPTWKNSPNAGFASTRLRAAAPWTLPSHANMFTGRWPHELDIKWKYPVGQDVPTLAEYLGSLGYATAGFVGNTLYCSYDCGLDRGFTCYRDYVLDMLNAAHSVRLVRVVLKFAQRRLGPVLADFQCDAHETF